jgi:hypothetical protein
MFGAQDLVGLIVVSSILQCQRSSDLNFRRAPNRDV